MQLLWSESYSNRRTGGEYSTKKEKLLTHDGVEGKAVLKEESSVVLKFLKSFAGFLVIYIILSVAFKWSIPKIMAMDSLNFKDMTRYMMLGGLVGVVTGGVPWYLSSKYKSVSRKTGWRNCILIVNGILGIVGGLEFSVLGASIMSAVVIGYGRKNKN